MRCGEVAVIGVAAGFDAEVGDGGVGDAVPVDVELLRAAVEEDEAGEIGRPLGVDEDLGVEGVAEPVGGEDVEPGPLVIPPVTAVLLNSVPDHQAGTASGLFNTSRQLGGALAVAAFGALLARPDGFLTGLRQSLLIAAGIGLATAATSRLLATSEHRVAADDVCVTADVPSAGACAAYIPVERGGAR